MSTEINFKGRSMTLLGKTVAKESVAPDFTVVSGDLKPVTLQDFGRTIKIITSFLSLDTGVCDHQVREFEKRALDMAEDIIVLGISRDLPFAQDRFCLANGIGRVKVLSDYLYGSFGLNYGLLIKELNLLARAIVIIDKNNVLRYYDVMKEATDTPDFDRWLSHLEGVVKDPALPVDDKLLQKCIPCKAGTPPLAEEEVEKRLKRLRGWQFDKNRIIKTCKFKDFAATKHFVDLIALTAEEQGHHPDLKWWYNKLDIELTTHAIGGLSENDFIMAALIDEL